MKQLPVPLVLVLLTFFSLALHSQVSSVQNAPAARVPGQVQFDPMHGLASGPDSVYVAPIAGAPFTATVAGEQVMRNPDNQSVDKSWNHSLVARDSSGRVYREWRNFSPNGKDTQAIAASMVYIDPVKHTYYRCFTETRTCYLYGLNLPADGTVPPHWGFTTGVKLIGASGSKVMPQSVGQKEIAGLKATGYYATFPLRSGVRIRNSQRPLDQDRPPLDSVTLIDPRDVSWQRYIREEGNDAVTDDALSTLPPARLALKASVSSEFWYSPDLQADLTVKYETPARAHAFMLVNLQRSEPDPKLFVPPAGYTLVDAARSRAQ